MDEPAKTGFTVSVLFVCMGNICRSPTAEGIFTRLVKEANLLEHIHIDSAGTIGYHAGNPPDERSILIAKERGVNLDHLIARQVDLNDFQEFDYILAMDNNNLAYLESCCPEKYKQKISLLLSHGVDLEVLEVPDPYYGGERGFEHVFELIENAAAGLFEKIRKEHKLK